MSEQAREALGSQELTALADRGYCGEEIKACDDDGIVPLVPKVFTSSGRSPIGCRLGWTIYPAASYHTASARSGHANAGSDCQLL